MGIQDMRAGILAGLVRSWTRFLESADSLPGFRGQVPEYALPGGRGRTDISSIAGIGSFSEAAEAGASLRPLPGGGGTPRGGGAGTHGQEGAGLPSLDQLYRKYSPSLYWVCMKYVRNKEDAEDMVNQVFVKVQQNLSGFKGQSGIYTWMYRIAVNECIQMFRRRKFEADPDSLPDFEASFPTYPEREMDAKLMLQRMMAATDSETAEILFLLYLEGLTQEEVVERMGISRSTVHRKVTDFKARMEKYR